MIAYNNTIVPFALINGKRYLITSNFKFKADSIPDPTPPQPPTPEEELNVFKVVIPNASTTRWQQIGDTWFNDPFYNPGGVYNGYSVNKRNAYGGDIYIWPAGCTQVAAAQGLYMWKWPWKLDAVHEANHVYNDTGRITLRYDGSGPINWDSFKPHYTRADTFQEKHEISKLMFMCESLNHVNFISAGTEAKKNLQGSMEWYEYEGSVTPYASSTAMLKAKNFLLTGAPTQIGMMFQSFGGHECLGNGFAYTYLGDGNYQYFIWLNFGWGGGSDGWYDLGVDNSVAGRTYITGMQIGFRPIKSVQIEPLPPRSSTNFTVKWHLPECYEDKISGFKVKKLQLDSNLTTWSDDFQDGGKGRTTNSGMVAATNNGLYVKSAASTGIYTWADKFIVGQDAQLVYSKGSAYMTGIKAQFEIKVDNEPWVAFHEIQMNSGRSSYYDNPNTVDDPGQISVSLSDYVGKAIQLRIYAEYTSGNGYFQAAANMKVFSVTLTNVYQFIQSANETILGPLYRQVSFNEVAGTTIAISVQPIMEDGSNSIVQYTTTSVENRVFGPPEILSFDYSEGGLDMLQYDMFAEIWSEFFANDIKVVCNSNVVRVTATSSIPTLIPDNRISVTRESNAGVYTGVFNIRIDTNGMESPIKWETQKMIITVKAYNEAGDFVEKDLIVSTMREYQ